MGLACWFELALIAAGVVSVGAAWAAARLLAAAGGFAGHPFPLTLAPLSQLWTHAWLTGWGILELYGGNFIGVTGWAGVTFAALHLIGLTLAIVAVAVALGRFIRPPGGQRPATAPRAHRRGGPRPSRTLGSHPGGERESTLVDSVLAVAVIANLRQLPAVDLARDRDRHRVRRAGDRGRAAARRGAGRAGVRGGAGRAGARCASRPAIGLVSVDRRGGGNGPFENIDFYLFSFSW